MLFLIFNNMWKYKVKQRRRKGRGGIDAGFSLTWRRRR
jgi:hypothetical protein